MALSENPTYYNNLSVVESECRESSLDDSGVDVTDDTAEPCLDDVSEEIQLYVQKLKNDNLDLFITNGRINEQIMFQLRFTDDLQLRYDESVDMTVSLRERIHELESREEKYKQSSNPEAVLGCFEELKNKNEECCRLKADLKQATDDMKLWRVRANILDIDNDFYKKKIEDLRESMIEISRENLVQKQATILKPVENLESNSQAQDKGSKPKDILMEPRSKPRSESGTPIAKVSTVTEDSRDESKRDTDSGVSLDEKTQRTSMVQQTIKGDREAEQKVPMLKHKQVKSAGLPTSDFHPILLKLEI
ncbi:uncharacterized protein LOC126825640 isoform X2 [Patella vulgata]|uniref:uncharacterized protein LOC126825640 isoform X2 n=1 Tax=Patella vulgata TaxID=6465 RepID=UPI00218072D7|nr:uncharacterized protein LOC126825640 isoform X2 [Patella vulgata]